MKLNVAITCPRELDLKGTAEGEVSLTISNQSGGLLKVKADVVAIDDALKGCLEIVRGERFWEFADKGTHNLSVKVKAPTNAVDGKARFRLVLADQANPDEVGAEGPEILVLVGQQVPVPPKPFPWWIVAVAAGVIILGVVGWIVWPKSVKVPDVVGKSMAEAKKLLEAVGLKGEPGDAVPAPAGEQIAEGHVAVQDPEATVPVKKGTEVKLFPRAKLPRMPTLVGKRLGDIIGQLNGYRMGPITRRRSPGRHPPDDTVLDQNPKPNEEVTSDREVVLVLEGNPGTFKFEELKQLHAERFAERAPEFRVLPPPPPPGPRRPGPPRAPP